jgi:hypothetical protein
MIGGGYMAKKKTWDGIEFPDFINRKSSGEKKSGYVADPSKVGYTVKLDKASRGRKFRIWCAAKGLCKTAVLTELVEKYIDSIPEDEYNEAVAEAAQTVLSK